jgi:Bacteriocin-protection, YdeI or OmpD-Associated
MPENPIAKKLRIKPAHRILLVNAPDNYAALLDPLPVEANLHSIAEGTFDVIQLFVKNSSELKRDLQWLQAHLRPDTILWITYPKKSSGIESDLEMMSSWKETSKYGLDGVAAAAINETWTALRFRPKDQIIKSKSRNSEIENNELGKYIDVKNRVITLPAEMKTALEEQPAAMNFFQSLSYSNKKEYIIWVLTAKQEKIKQERVSKTVEKLAAGKKNPAEK